MKNLGCAIVTLLLSVAPAFADVHVSTPANGQTVDPSTQYVATATTNTCSRGVASMGVYIDNSLIYVVNGTSMNTAINLPSGNHHTVVEEWDYCGGATFTPVDVVVNGGGNNGGGGNGGGGIPPNATSSGDLTGSGRWAWSHDAGTPGSSVGSSSYPVGNPSVDNTSRQFSVSYSHFSGERYHISFGYDPNATHFVIDSYVYIADPSQVQNIEIDMNQVMSDGRTVIFGTQCASGTRTWEFTTITGHSPHWHPSNIPCNPQSWAANTWRHVQIATHRDGAGVVTYDWVNVDGTVSNFQNASGDAALSLRWATGDLLLNFQLDGARGDHGSMTAYIDKMSVYRW